MMLRCKPMVLIVFLFILMVNQGLAHASEPAREYLEAIKLYNEGSYKQAASLFESVAVQGVVNGKLFYNIGNAYAKQGDVGHAMLWYERALKYIPHDPDLVYNHDYMTGLLKDKFEDKTSPIYNVLFFWKDLLTPIMIQWLALILFSVFWVRVIIALIRAKRVVRIWDGIVLTFALIFTLTSYYDYYDDAFHKKAIVVSEAVSVRSGLSDDSTELFILHAGTPVEVDDQLRGYVKIRFAKDKIGWAKKDLIEII